MKIGYPRAVHYYDHFPFWAGFFKGLDLELITSPLTNRTILEKGLKKASDDTCLPIKILAGHMQALSDVDAIFLPRMVSVEEKTYLCPKILGLPESVLAAVPQGVTVVTLDFNVRAGKRQLLRSLEEFAESLGKSRAEARQGFLLGRTWQERFERLRLQGRSFIESMSEFDQRLPREMTATKELIPGEKKEQLTIGLVGHNYLTQESYANLNLLEKLGQRASVRFIEEAEPRRIEQGLRGLRKPMFWSHARKILGAGVSYVEDQAVDGVIYLSCFGCGTDSMTQDMVARVARQNHKPYMTLTLDEHSGEAGLVTRLEAFLDMTERRVQHEGDFSAHG